MHFRLDLLAPALLMVGLCGCASPESGSTTDPAPDSTPAPVERLEIQGHRGARGLLPENTIPGFVLALREGADVLEMDLCISADGQVIVSHEPWMNHEMCRTPEGRDITAEEARSFNLRAMTAGQIADFDCGLRPHPRFPDQQHLPAHKPTLAEVVQVIETVPLLDGAPVRYNLEIKHKPEYEPQFCPDAATFARLVIAEVQRLGIGERTCIQSFSSAALEAVHEQAPDWTTAWLVDSDGPVEAQLDKLSFRPDIYSPNWKRINADDVHALQSQGIRVIPWTVNEGADLFAVMQMGVDGIITDYPDRLYGMR